MANQDIRWIQRFHNYRKALKRLNDAIALTDERALSELERQGLIQAFEFTFDMAWKTLQDYVTEKGYAGERDKPIRIFVEATMHHIIDEQAWRDMYKSRNKSSHTYDEAIADAVYNDIVTVHYVLLIQLETRLQIEKLNTERNLFNRDETQ